MRLIAPLALILAPALAFAQSEEAPQVRYQERTEIDFEEVDVSGELLKPQGQLLLERRRASFNPLIELRTEFNDEMRDSIDEVK
jgi:hypothetical protein